MEDPLTLVRLDRPVEIDITRPFVHKYKILDEEVSSHIDLDKFIRLVYYMYMNHTCLTNNTLVYGKEGIIFTTFFVKYQSLS